MQLGVQQGLPASEVYNLFQDDLGYVWACTEYGIVKHNGARFIQACKNLPFDESKIYAIRRSIKGEVFIANSKARIYRIKNDSAFLIEGMDTATQYINHNNEVIFDMQVNSVDDIYFSTYHSSYHYFHKQIMSLSNSNADTSILLFKQAGMGYAALYGYSGSRNLPIVKIIVGNQKGAVCEFNMKSLILWRDRSNLREDNTYYYIHTQKTLFRVHKITRAIKTADIKGIISFEVSPQGNLWLGTNKGLYLLDTALNVRDHYFANSIVSDILFDRNNGAWVSTLEQGVFYCSNTGYISYDNITGVPANISMLKRIDSVLFIGTSDGRLFTMKNETIRQVDIGQGVYSINDICRYKSDYMVGTKGRIYFLSPSMIWLKQRAVPGFKGVMTNSYGFINQSSDTLLMLTAGSIIKIPNRNGDPMASRIYTNATNRIIIQREKGEFFVGTSRGVMLLNDTLSIPPSLEPLKGIGISMLKADQKGNIWICTPGHGLFILDKRNRLLKFANCPFNVVNGITFDKDNTLLLSANTGLYRYTRTGFTGRPSWIRQLEVDASGSEIYQNKIFVATQQGLISIDRQKLLTSFNPVFYLESVSTEKRTLDTAAIEITHNENDLYFRFDILSYDNPESSLKFRLDGPDGVQHFSGRTLLHLQNLDPGNYTLLVNVLDHDQNVNGTSFKRISFYVKPAFWQTRIFSTLAVTAFLGLTGLLMWLIMRRMKNKDLRRRMIIRELAENRLAALKAQINPHFISNSLTAIQHLVNNNEIDRANLYIARFSELIRYALDHSDKVLTRLSNEIGVIETVIALEQLRFKDQFVFETDISDDIDPTTMLVPPLITQPIIENAIWHGLLPLKGLRKPKLILRIHQSNQELHISIIDNGVGRNMNTISKPGRESKGTKLINSWIENLNKLFPEDGASIYIIDLFNEENIPNGTSVNIVLNIKALKLLQNDKQ